MEVVCSYLLETLNVISLGILVLNVIGRWRYGSLYYNYNWGIESIGIDARPLPWNYICRYI